MFLNENLEKFLKKVSRRESRNISISKNLEDLLAPIIIQPDQVMSKCIQIWQLYTFHEKLWRRDIWNLTISSKTYRTLHHIAPNCPELKCPGSNFLLFHHRDGIFFHIFFVPNILYYAQFYNYSAKAKQKKKKKPFEAFPSLIFLARKKRKMEEFGERERERREIERRGEERETDREER